MQKKNNIIEMIGNTPLIYLKGASEETGCKIYGKAEFLNPGQSVKDRAALYLIKDADKRPTALVILVRPPTQSGKSKLLNHFSELAC